MQRTRQFNESFAEFAASARTLTQQLVDNGETRRSVDDSTNQYVDTGTALTHVIIEGPDATVDEEAAGIVVAMIGIDLSIATQAAVLATWWGDPRSDLGELSNLMSPELLEDARAAIESRRAQELKREDLHIALRSSSETVNGLLDAIRDGQFPNADQIGWTSIGPGAMPSFTVDATVNAVVDKTATDLTDILVAATAPLATSLAMNAASALVIALKSQVSMAASPLWWTVRLCIKQAAAKFKELLDHVGAVLPDVVRKFMEDLDKYLGGRVGHAALNPPLAWEQVVLSSNTQLTLAGVAYQKEVNQALDRVRHRHWWSRSWVPGTCIGLTWVVCGNPALAVGFTALLVIVDLWLAHDFLDSPTGAGRVPDIFTGVQRSIAKTIGPA